MRRVAISAAIIIGLIVPGTADAHPGGLDSRGGHYCRTNCAKWGEVEGAWHSHRAPAAAEVPPQSDEPEVKVNTEPKAVPIRVKAEPQPEAKPKVETKQEPKVNLKTEQKPIEAPQVEVKPMQQQKVERMPETPQDEKAEAKSDPVPQVDQMDAPNAETVEGDATTPTVEKESKPKKEKKIKKSSKRKSKRHGK